MGSMDNGDKAILTGAFFGSLLASALFAAIALSLFAPTWPVMPWNAGFEDGIDAGYDDGYAAGYENGTEFRANFWLGTVPGILIWVDAIAIAFIVLLGAVYKHKHAKEDAP